MIQNNLDPDVAERPQDLVVYGGIGKAARNWTCFHAILDCLKKLENDLEGRQTQSKLSAIVAHLQRQEILRARLKEEMQTLKMQPQVDAA